MNRLYLVTEGPADTKILQRLLPTQVASQTEFVQARHDALSLATTLLTVRRRPLALVIDADTTNAASVQERVDSLRFLLRQAGGNVPHEIFVAVPEIEIVFLQDRALFERLVQRSLSDLEWRLAQLSPKETITSLVRPSSSVMDLLAQLTERDIAVLRQHELIKGISDFLFRHLNWIEYPLPAYDRTPVLAVAEAGVSYQTDEDMDN